MALTKRVYTDGETIITAQNLNDIQDEIISQGNTLVPKTRTINSKALSSNITLTSGDIGYNSSTTYSSGSVGKAVSDLNGAINNYYPKTGGTVNGDVESTGNMISGGNTILTFPTANIKTAPSSNVQKDALFIRDNAGNNLGFFRFLHDTSNGYSWQIAARRPFDNYTVFSGMKFLIDGDGRTAIDVTKQTWRTGLGLFTPAVSGGQLVVFGDSWSTGQGVSASQAFPHLIATELGMTRRSYAVSGAGFIRTGNLISTQIDNAVSGLTATQKDDIAMILISGGVNDYKNMSSSSADTFATAVVNAVNAAKALKSLAPVVVVLGSTYLSPPPIGYREWIAAATNKIYDSVNTPCLVINKLDSLMCAQTSYYQNDQLHPTVAGHRAIANYIIDVILGSPQENIRQIGRCTLVSGNTFHNNGTFYCTVKGDRCWLGGGRINFGTSIGNTQTKIGSLPSAYIAPNSIKFTNSVLEYVQNGVVSISTAGDIYFKSASTTAQSYCYISDMEWQINSTGW